MLALQQLLNTTDCSLPLWPHWVPERIRETSESSSETL